MCLIPYLYASGVMPQPGFTKEELEAYKWSKQRRGSKDSKYEKRRSYSPSSSANSSDSDIPKDPFNPLLLSTNKDYRKSRRRRSRSRSPGKWDHELYYVNAESGSDDERRTKPKRDFDTRAGAWRSRAGGAYLPPERPLTEDEKERMYPTYRYRRRSISPYERSYRSYSPSPSRPSPTYDD